MGFAVDSGLSPVFIHIPNFELIRVFAPHKLPLAESLRDLGRNWYTSMYIPERPYGELEPLIL